MSVSLTACFSRSARLAAALTLCAATSQLHAQASAKQDMHAAGQDSRNAAVDTGHATRRVAHKTAHGTRVAARKTKSGAITAGHDVAHGTKVAAHDTANETRRVGDKIAGKPAPPQD